jgi:hypothetical protein
MPIVTIAPEMEKKFLKEKNSERLLLPLPVVRGWHRLDQLF